MILGIVSLIPAIVAIFASFSRLICLSIRLHRLVSPEEYPSNVVIPMNSVAGVALPSNEPCPPKQQSSTTTSESHSFERKMKPAPEIAQRWETFACGILGAGSGIGAFAGVFSPIMLFLVPFAACFFVSIFSLTYCTVVCAEKQGTAEKGDLTPKEMRKSCLCQCIAPSIFRKKVYDEFAPYGKRGQHELERGDTKRLVKEITRQLGGIVSCSFVLSAVNCWLIYLLATIVWIISLFAGIIWGVAQPSASIQRCVIPDTLAADHVRCESEYQFIRYFCILPGVFGGIALFLVIAISVFHAVFYRFVVRKGFLTVLELRDPTRERKKTRKKHTRKQSNKE